MECYHGTKGPIGTKKGAALLGARKEKFLVHQILEESCVLEDARYVLGQCDHGDDKASKGTKGNFLFTRQRVPTLQKRAARFAVPSCRQWTTGHNILRKDYKALLGESARRMCREA